MAVSKLTVCLPLKSFWIFYRMIILASLASGMSAAADMGRWLPLGYFPCPAEWTLDSWQSKVVYLLGSVQNFWARTRNKHDKDTLEELNAEWKSLGDQLLRHQSQAPVTCQPLSIIPPNDDTPFETVRYVNGPVSAAWQMLHTAYLVLAISQPSPRAARLALLSSPEVTRKASLFAKKIVSNSITNRCTIAWANAVQLLTIAGQCLVEAGERQACLRALDDIQHHTGWDTRANMDRLSAAWRRRAAGSVDADAEMGMLLYNVWTADEDAS